jgi:PAS domain S-box-containing protein
MPVDRTSELIAKRLVEANVVGIVMWNFEGAIMEANEAFLRMVGYDREDLASGRCAGRTLCHPNGATAMHGH